MLSDVVASARAHARTRWGIAAVALVLAGAVVLVAYPYGGAQDAAGVAPLRTYALRGAFLGPASSFSADPLLASRTSPLVVVAPAAGGVDARVLVGRRVVATQRVSLPAGPGERALARWGGGEVAIALVQARARDVAVTAASLDSGRRLANARLRVAPPLGAAVDARLGSWSGDTSDLFVVVWPRPGALRAAERATGARPAARLDVLDGAAAFGRRELSVGLPSTIARPADWDVLVARASGPLSDLVLVRCRGAAHPEVHVLSGESHFRQFILHAQLDLPGAVARRARFVVASERGRPVLDVIDPAAGRARVRVFPLGSSLPGT